MKDQMTPLTSSPLTPALSPLRGEGVALDVFRTSAVGLRAGAFSLHDDVAPRAANAPVQPGTPPCAPSPLNGERAGVRGEAVSAFQPTP
jgi:hypothetical protein